MLPPGFGHMEWSLFLFYKEAASVVQLSETPGEITVRDSRSYMDSRQLFEFDACFPPAATQEQVFEQVITPKPFKHLPAEITFKFICLYITVSSFYN